MKKLWLFLFVLITPVSAYLQLEVQLFRYLHQTDEQRIQIHLKLIEIPGSVFKKASFLVEGLDDQDGIINCYAFSKDTLLYLGTDTLSIQKNKPVGYITEKQIRITNTSLIPLQLNQKALVFKKVPEPSNLEEIVIVQPKSIPRPPDICSGMLFSDKEACTGISMSPKKNTDSILIDAADLNTLQQETTELAYPSEQDPECWEIVEDPVFPGGEAALSSFINANITYTPEMLDSLIKGVVYVQFVIEKDGTVSHVEVKKSIHVLYDREAIRVVSSMPTWKPGVNICGKPARVRYIIPISFKRDY